MIENESTVAAEELGEGQWFLHVPAPGMRGWPLKVAAREFDTVSVRIHTTDEVREVVSYARDRRVPLLRAHV
ncbi:hypothetical protein [Umezawaea sp.]|uniref:hypothetical protein n=1 Tax=Umezawaea sp. TaxID=1955258 RepID=UPI002ED20D3D